MTLGRFQELLRKIDPRLRVRVRGEGDIVGLFVGMAGKGGYICRMSQGEFSLKGYRLMNVDPAKPWNMRQGRIMKRGRETVVKFLKNYRWLTKPQQVSMLLWGIDYPDEEVRGITYEGGTSHGRQI